MHWQAHQVRGGSFDNKKNIPWMRKRNLQNSEVLTLKVIAELL